MILPFHRLLAQRLLRDFEALFSVVVVLQMCSLSSLEEVVLPNVELAAGVRMSFLGQTLDFLRVLTASVNFVSSSTFAVGS